MARSVREVSGRRIFRDEWLFQSFAGDPIHLEGASAGRVPDGSGWSLTVPKDFDVSDVREQVVRGSFDGLRAGS